MIKKLTVSALLCFSVSAFAENTIDEAPPLKDIFYGEALFYAFQDNYFDAITKVDTELGQYYALDEPTLDPFSIHINHAEFSVGSFELAYRMHQRAGRAIKAIMESHVDQKVRNEAAYRLAKIFYQKNQPVNAMDILDNVKGDMPEDLRVDETYLRAQVYISTGKFTEAAELLESIRNEEKYVGFIQYNLGIAYIQSGKEEKGVTVLDNFGQMNTSEPAVLALKDKANLTLASRMMEKGAPDRARTYFNRVRINGPFANRALLGSGWANVSLGQFKKALVPWRILHERNVTNEEVQESMLAVPYAYSQLHYYGQSAVSYGKAMDSFGSEIDRLQSSIKSVREGKFLKAVLDKQSERDKNWLYNLRNMQDTPETRYILSLMASHDFQESLKNYRDLADLKIRLNYWLDSLDVYLELIEIRRRYYEPLLPVVEKQFKKLDSRIRLRMEQRDRLDQRLKAIIISRRPDFLATGAERTVKDKLEKMEEYLSTHKDRDTKEVRERISRLRGVIDWQINQHYHERLTNAYKQMSQLDVYVKNLNEAYQSFVRTRQAATQSYEGYELPILQLKTRINAAQLKVDGIMARQGRVIEAMAENELERRRNQLEEYQIKARFALAESYDRATKKQEKAEEQRLLEEHQQREAEKKQAEEQKNKEQLNEKPAETSQPEAKADKVVEPPVEAAQ